MSLDYIEFIVMDRGEKLKVFFKMNERYYGLFNIIQMGVNGIIDLKITNYYNNLAIVAENIQDEEKGYLTEEEIEKSRFIHQAEMSYHKDGSFLHKFKDRGNIEYSNPYGEGERWTSTNCINDFQPIFNIAIRRMSIYNKSSESLILKSRESAYICENDELFEPEGTYFLICYIRNKNFPVNRFTNSQSYSDIITPLNDELDLCILIQRHSYPIPKPYYSEHFKCMITPYLNNSINFCNKESAKDEMMDKLKNAVFDPTFNHFLQSMTDGNFINLTESKLQLIDQVDIFYRGKEGKLPVSKPIFIKLALNYLGDNLSDFNKLPFIVKQSLIQTWNNELELEKIRQSENK